MPHADIVTAAEAAGCLLGDWAADPSTGGPLAGHAHAEVRAVAGAGKTYQLNRAARRALRRSRRVLLIAHTNNQVRDLAQRLAALGVTVLHFAAPGEEIVAPPAGLVSSGDRARLHPARCVVATVYKAGKTAKEYPDQIGHFDLGFVDEAYQVRSTNEALWALGLAGRWAFVGDPGQIPVFTTLGRSPYLGDDDPVTSIVESAQAQGADLGVLDFPFTWRLAAHGAAGLRPFYGRDVASVATADDRELLLGPRPLRRGLARAGHTIVERAAQLGWGFIEIPGNALDPCDELTARGIAAVVAALHERRVRARCERNGTRLLGPADIGVAVATDAQRGVVVQALAAAGAGRVEVRTFNRHQGLEYAVLVLWHPLSGVGDLDDFYLDLGRLCVGVSRHRHACIAVGRSGLRGLLEDPPLSPEAPWPGRRDRLLTGWTAHVSLLDRLDHIGATVAV